MADFKKNIRKIALILLKTFNPGKIKIKHPRTGYPFVLDAYLHKGYWFRGKKVDMHSMNLFQELIAANDTVIEAGAHIGLMTQLFSKLAGKDGLVYTFEPGINNLTYLRKNISLCSFPNIVLIEKAVSNQNGTAVFYIENYTGQNNSLIPDHIGINAYNKNTTDKNKAVLEVETVTLDSFCSENNISKVDFIKVDIEGAEIMAIGGMIEMLRKYKPSFMFEVTQNSKEIFDNLKKSGYILFDESKRILTQIDYSGNVFGIHEDNKNMLTKISLVLPGN